mmetsp:Transcript_4125/g.8229  ORF Transcript_4125/g.8229 Transcript_4125/m.8229 type:complete len:180 (+) Transcript_4125:817-1356(+)
MFALTLRETGMDIPARLFLTVFLCLIISFLMSILFKNCGFNRMFSGAGCVGKCVTIGILMVIPATICGVVIVIYLFRQEDNGAEAGILFVATTVLSLLLEILLWYFVYDCCKAYCSCFLCCCPNLLDDAEVAAADVAHAKKVIDDGIFHIYCLNQISSSWCTWSLVFEESEIACDVKNS